MKKTVSLMETSASVDTENVEIDGNGPTDCYSSNDNNKSVSNSVTATGRRKSGKMVLADAIRCKEEGNRYFSQQKYEAAHESYQQGLKHVLSEEESSSLSLKVALLSNSAITSNKLNSYTRAENECTKALKLIMQQEVTLSEQHPEITKPSSAAISAATHAKVWYRRAQAREYMGLWNEALDDLQQCLSLLQEIPNSEQTSATTIIDVQKMMARIHQKLKQKVSSSIDNDHTNTKSINKAIPPNTQKYIILQLLQQNTKQQEQHQFRCIPIQPGEAFFLINFHWWKQWCDYVDLFQITNNNKTIKNQKNLNDEPDVKFSSDHILSLLPMGAYFPSRSNQQSQQQSHRRLSSSSMDDDDESSSNSSMSTTSSADMNKSSLNNNLKPSHSSYRPSPGVIDNSSLFISSNDAYASLWCQLSSTPGFSKQNQSRTDRNLRTNLVRGHHYEVLPREVYAALRCWYGERTPPICFRAQQIPSHNTTMMNIILYPHHQRVENPIQQENSNYKSRQLRKPNETFNFTCSACFSIQAQSRCTKCMAVYYCGRACQASHWPYHKHLCKSLSKHTASISKEPKLHSRLGCVGLNNLGNTCFMNSALQCLSHACPLTRHFLSNAFQNDLNTSNPLGTAGKLANAYNVLLRELWMGNSNSFSPTTLKRAIAMFAPRFAGCAQHDAQEFLAFLLDGLHEDLNRIQNPPYIEMPEVTECKKLTVAGAEAWDTHCRRNDSLVMDNFYGQFKSTCVCPQCNKVSITFDAFNHISLEIPSYQNNNRTIAVYLFDSVPLQQIQSNVNVDNDSPLSPPSRYGVTISKNASIGDLKNALSNLSGIPSSRLVLCDIYGNNVYEVLNSNKAVSTIRSEDLTAAYHVDSFQSESIHAIITHHQFVTEIKPPNLLPTKKSVIFGLPLMISFNPNISCNQIWQLIRKNISFAISDSGVIISPEKLQQILRIRVTDNNGKPRPIFSNLLRNQNDFINDPIPESMLPIMSDEKIVKYMGEGFAENFLFLSLEWKINEESMKLDPKRFSQFSDHSSLLEAIKHEKAFSSNTLSLDNCFENFTRPERLDDNNKWYCSHCRMHVRAMKTMELWKLPNILIIHLKRFEFKNALRREKLDTFVNFPIDGLDMSKHCASMFHNFCDKEFVIDDVPANYDLFAVTNHYGRMGFGHYTAYARRWNEEGMLSDWAVFDDSNVQKIGDGHGRANGVNVITPAAYVLFYRRRVFT